MKKLLMIFMIACLLASCAGETKQDRQTVVVPEAEEDPVLNTDEKTILPEEKKEVVYVDTDAYGSVIKTSVDVTLKGISDSGYVLDESMLENIRNIEGDEQNYIYGDQIAWDNYQSDIKYKGDIDKEVPVGVYITYYLDGKKINAEQLSGKKGHLKIRFDYFNRTSKKVTVNDRTYDMHIPFMMMTTIFLSDDVFENVKVKNAKVLEMSGEKIFVGMGFPGLKEDLELQNYSPADEIEIPSYCELEADVKDFSLDYTLTIATTDYLEDLDNNDIRELEDSVDDLNKVKNDIGKLKDGTNEFNDGLNAYKDGLDSYFDGVDELSKALGKYSDGFKTLNENSSAMKDGADSLTAGLGEIDKILKSIDTESLKTFTDPETSKTLDALMEKINGDVESLNSDNEEIVQLLKDVETFIDDAGKYSDTIMDKKNEIETILSSAEISELAKNANDEAIAQAKQLVEDAMASMDLNEDEKLQISESLDSIDISDSFTALDTSIDEIANILNSIGQLDVPDLDTQLESMNTACEDLRTDLSSLLQIINGDEQALKTLSVLPGLIENLQEGISSLSSGSGEYAKGIEGYVDGVDSLYQSTVQIRSGMNELDKASSKLEDGLSEILEGFKEMKDGISEFDEEAINKINKYAGSSFRNVIRRLKGLKSLDQSYQNFSGIPEGVKGSVYFVIESEEIR